jgi:hypothetical protein
VEYSLRLDSDRPWRALTLIATTIAAVEFVVIFSAFLAKPLVVHLKNAAVEHAAAEEAAQIPKPPPIGTPKLMRTRTSVLVLNGNGRTGAAAREAQRVRSRGYTIGGVGDARRTGYARSLVMYRDGFRAEAFRLARDLRIRVVGPLDGMKPRELLGAHLAVIVGNR